MSIVKYITLRNIIPTIIGYSTKFFIIFKFNGLGERKALFTYIYDLEVNDCSELFKKIRAVFKITLNESNHYCLSKRWFSVKARDNDYFISHLKKNGYEVFIFNDNVKMEQMHKLNSQLLNRHRVFKRKNIADVFDKMKINEQSTTQHDEIKPETLLT